MNEPAEKGRISQIVEAEQTIKVLGDELLKYKAFASKWMINFDVKVEPKAITITAKTGERGLIRTIDESTISYYVDDADTIANNIAMEILSNVLGEVVKNELAPQLARAIRNASRLNKSSL
jgi:hypothetical protein